MPLDGRSAMVTGASGDIGRAIAVALAARGAQVCVAGRDERRLAETVSAVEAHGRPAVALACDLTEPSRVEQLAELVATAHGGLEVLVHSAGSYQRGDLATSSVADLDAQYRVNVRLPYLLTQAVLPMLVRGRGDIVFVNSTQGLSASAGVGQYAATQHAKRAVADSLRAEANRAGVRVTTLHVGRTATTLQERIFASEDRPYPPDTLIQPEDLGELVVAAVTLPRRAQVTTLTVWPTQPA
ncbi:MAG TPA: SDR family NAD(P)-dependent oxidoreductase [Pseudonocardiaceae bacterium]|nr:SDR family NAD(P)-dependent oxidoreductase [Pseudonocardiaceae bacterium]